MCTVLVIATLSLNQFPIPVLSHAEHDVRSCRMIFPRFRRRMTDLQSPHLLGHVAFVSD
uniref:Secreted protein n=1 Tax=Ascaris lumbricoides TaxID=6252 RepID=A0A0M3IR96_ASCLU